MTLDVQVQHAGQIGAARELYEETGIDLRDQLERIRPICLYDDRAETSSLRASSSILVNEYKHRLFYILLVTDSDFTTASVSLNNDDTGRIGAMGTDLDDCNYKHITVCISFVGTDLSFWCIVSFLIQSMHFICMYNIYTA
jgi:hypothetical protein